MSIKQCMRYAIPLMPIKFSTVKIIGNILEDKWFDYESFFDDMKNDTADDKGTEVIWRRNT